MVEGSRHDVTRVERLLSQMTWAEKLGQLQIVFKPDPEELRCAIRGGIGAVFWPRDATRTNELQRLAVEETRLGIPLLVGLDVIHGQYTIAPTPLAQASSFDPVSVRAAARLAAQEAASGGVNWTFSPMIDVSRDPRWGRVVEGFGEDPVVNAVMGVAMVDGYQNEDLAASESIAATAKHYIGYGHAEGGRDYSSADMSERQLHNTYLPPFRAVVESGVASVMAAFNTVGGRPLHAHHGLLTGELKDGLGFGGVIVGDADGVVNLVAHGVASDLPDAVRQALGAGLDVEMGGNLTTTLGDSLLEEGTVAASRVDDAVRRVLTLKERLGLFDQPYIAEVAAITGSSERARAIVRELAVRSMVLLKNDGTLPISPQGRILLTGPYAESADHLGAWTQSFATPAGTIADAFRSFTDVDLVVEAGCDFFGDSSDIQAAVAAALSSDLVIACVGEPSALSGEATSRSSLKLPGEQEALLLALAETGVPVVAVLENGRPLDLSAWIDRVPAVIEAWHAGTEAPAAIVDVLIGTAEPAGRLPMSFPRSVGQVPIFMAHEPTGRPATTGGRIPGAAVDVALVGPGDVAGQFTSKYIDAELGPMFTFGHGGGYASFSHSAPRVSATELQPTRDGGVNVVVSIDVTNTSSRAGDETIFVFLQDPVSRVSQPVRRLLAFARKRITAGSTEQFTFALTDADLSYWDVSEGKVNRVLESGELVLHVGSTLMTAAPVTMNVTAYLTRLT